MKKFLTNIWKTPMFLVFCAISLLYGLPALGASAEIDRFAIITSIGIDMIEDDMGNNYEVSALTFIPIAEESFAETYKVVSSKGRSVSEAMDLVGLHIGKQVGLSHVKTVVLNEQLLEQDVSKFLDYLSRSKNMSASTSLIATDSSAKEFLQAVEKLDSLGSIKLSELVNFNAEYIYATDSSFETFFKGLFGPTRVSWMPFLSLDEKNSNGISVANIKEDDKNFQPSSNKGSSSDSGSGTSSQSSGSESSGGSSGDNKEIVNNGDTVFLKDGAKKIILSGKELKKINLIRGNFNTGSIEIYDFTGGLFENANLVFEIFGKNIRNKITFENGVPVVYIDMELTLVLSEVDNPNGMIEKNVEFFVIPEDCVDAIEKKVRESMSDAIEIMRDNQLDINDFYTLMHNSDRKSFNNFIKNLEDKDDYLNRIVFKTGVKIYSK